MDSTLLNNNSVIQSLLQRADELSKTAFSINSTLSGVDQEQYSTSNSFDMSNAVSDILSDLSGFRIEEVDPVTANQLVQSLSSPTVYQQYQFIETNNRSNMIMDEPTPGVTLATHHTGEFFQDPNGPQIIRRSPIQGPVTYRQNVSVRFLQPPPVPPPGPLIIKEVRSPQPPTPPPLIIRQHAVARPAPPPLVLRERPPQPPPLIPTQTIIKKLPPTPVPPRSIIVERCPPIPPQPRDIIIERWIPYSKEAPKRKVIIQRAPPPRPYPPARNAIIVYEPIQVNVVRSVQRLGIQPQNPQEYVHRYGHSLLDSSTLITQMQQIGITDDLGPSLSSYTQQYHTDQNMEYYVDTPQTVWESGYEYSAATMENQTASNNEQTQVYWTDPQEDIHTILQHLGLAVE